MFFGSRCLITTASVLIGHRLLAYWARDLRQCCECCGLAQLFLHWPKIPILCGGSSGLLVQAMRDALRCCIAAPYNAQRLLRPKKWPYFPPLPGFAYRAMPRLAPSLFLFE